MTCVYFWSNKTFWPIYLVSHVILKGTENGIEVLVHYVKFNLSFIYKTNTYTHKHTNRFFVNLKAVYLLSLLSKGNGLTPSLVLKLKELTNKVLFYSHVERNT